VIDGLGVLANFALFLWTNVLDSDERKFLANVGYLHDLFYDHTVIDVIRKFNRQCAHTKRVNMQESKLNKDFADLVTTLTSKLSVLQLPAASKNEGTPGAPPPAPDAAKDGPKDGGHTG
jgi:hypothetical protein